MTLNINETQIIEISSNRDLTKTAESVKREIPKYWDKEFINNRIELVDNMCHKVLLKFLWMSGVRITEAVNLKKENIDFKNYVITVRWLKSRKYKHRVVPLHPKLRDVLQMFTAPMKEGDLVFKVSRQRAWQLTQKYLGGHPHQLRHSFAVNWLRCGGDVVVLHRILGHSKIQTTMEYLKIVPVDQGRELLKIDF